VDFRITTRAFGILLIVSLAGYGFSQIGVPGTPIDSFWKLLALSIAIAIVSGAASPYIRGIKKDDQLVATIKRNVMHDNQMHTHIDNVVVSANESGRVGQKIRVKLFNGKRAEGIILGYAGTFNLATIKLTESEV
jgi:hypothetical protein